MQYPSHLLKLIQVLRRLPGVGTKSAERFAFNMLTWPDEYVRDFGETILTTKAQLKQCEECGCLIDHHKCHFCDLSRRDPSIMCVLSSPREVFSIEGTHEYKGIYHVLGALLSPLENRGPDQLSLQKLKDRVESLGVKEIVIAFDSTLEGDATALFIKQELSNFPIQVSRLAFGLPMGSSLEYVDGGTLTKALTGRNSF